MQINHSKGGIRLTQIDRAIGSWNFRSRDWLRKDWVIIVVVGVIILMKIAWIIIGGVEWNTQNEINVSCLVVRDACWENCCQSFVANSRILILLWRWWSSPRRLEYISPGNFVSPAVFVWNRKINIRKSHNNALLYAKAFWLLIELFIDIAMENLSDEASDSENEVNENVDNIAENNPRSGDWVQQWIPRLFAILELTWIVSSTTKQK